MKLYGPQFDRTAEADLHIHSILNHMLYYHLNYIGSRHFQQCLDDTVLLSSYSPVPSLLGYALIMSWIIFKNSPPI